MNSAVHFLPVLPLYWLLPVAVLLMLVLGWQEHRKPYRFRVLRVAAQVVAILALLGLVLRPSWDVSIERAKLIVLTDNYSKNALDSLWRKEPGLKVVRVMEDSTATPFSTKGGLRIAANEEVEVLASYRELPKRGMVRYVLGDGIPIAYLDYFDDFQFLPGRDPHGVVELSIQAYPEHRKNWLYGKVRGSKGSRLTLKGPGGVEDSVVVRTNELFSFALGFTSKIPGRYVYALAVRDSAGGTREEELPVEVFTSRRLSILLLQAYPQAEVRFLKNYLAGKGHRLVTRYQLSKYIFRYEVANDGEKPAGALDAAKLEAFDLVIADDGSWKSLSGEEARETEAAVRRGLGLLVLLNGLPDTRQFPGDVLQLSPVGAAPDTVRYSLGSFGSFTGPFVATKAGQRVQTILRSDNYLLQGLALHGSGKVAVQSLRETYRLALRGDNSAYAALWTPLLEQSARREDLMHKVRISTPFPIYPDEPVGFDLIGVATKVSEEGINIPLAEDVTVDDHWQGRFWAGEAGWNTLTVGESDQHHFFIAKPGGWKSLRTEVQRRMNRQATGTTDEQGSVVQVQRKEFPRWVFFLVFVLAMGMVWVGAKV